MMSELPAGWVSVRADEVLTFSYGKGLPARSRRPGRVGVYASAGRVGEHDESLTDESAIIIGRKGAAGKVTVTDGPSWTIDTAYFVVPPSELSLVFLAYQLEALGLVRLDQSTAIPSLSRDDLNALELVLAPRAEQDRIVAAIESAFASVDEAEDSLTQAIELRGAFEASIRHSVFAVDNETEDGSAGRLTLGELCAEVGGSIQTGPFGSQLHKSDYSETGTPVLMPKDLDYGRIDPSSVARVSDLHVERLARHKVQPGDIVQSRRGDLRRRALVTEREAGWLCGTGCFLIRLRDPELARWVCAHLGEPETAAIIDARAAGVTMPNLNAKVLAGLELAVPSLRTREASLKRLDAALAEASRLFQQAAVPLSHTEVLRQSILHRAFNGQLVPQDSGDEPASALLERIRTARILKRGRSARTRHKPSPARSAK